MRRLLLGAGPLPRQEEEKEGVQELHGGGGVLCKKALAHAKG